MTPAELAADLRTRINPIYAAQLGTESYERRLCAETIEALAEELAALKGQEPVAHLYIDSYGTVKLGQLMPPEEGSFSVYLAAGAQPEYSCPYCGGTKGHWEGCKAPVQVAINDKEITMGLGHETEFPFDDLTAAAQPVAAQAQERKPLTDEQIDAAWRSVDYTQPYDDFRMAVGRAIEAKVRERA